MPETSDSSVCIDRAPAAREHDLRRGPSAAHDVRAGATRSLPRAEEEGDTRRNPLRVGLVGAGYIAAFHARALRNLARTRMVAVCDLSSARAESFASAYPDVQAYGSLEAMLDAERLDAVHLLTPPDSHAALACAALQAGAHVYLEKPMAADVAGCEQVCAAAERSGRSVGVNHNFLFYRVYEQLRAELHSGVLGRVEHVTLAWNFELPQITHGPFNLWMLAQPGNLMLEIGAHTFGQLLDLLGMPADLRVDAARPAEVPQGRRVYRRWHVSGTCGASAFDAHFSFVPGFPERFIHVHGALGSAHVDFEHNTYTLLRHGRASADFDRFARLRRWGRGLRNQAWGNLRTYLLSRLKLSSYGNAYEESIARAAGAFYASLAADRDIRLRDTFGRDVIALCTRVVEEARLPAPAPRVSVPAPARQRVRPEILVLGGTGFIGRELVRQLLDGGKAVRVMTRNAGAVPFAVGDEPRLEIFEGSPARDDRLRAALQGVRSVVHLARAHARTWQEYYEQDVQVTRRIAEACLAAGVERLIYTGTISSFYTGGQGDVITDDTPVDPQYERRDHYSRAKALSEHILRELHRTRGLPVIITRPGIVIGRGGSPYHWGVGMWNGMGVCQLWGAGDHPLPFVLVEDVARGLIRCLETPGIEGRAFNLVGPPLLTGARYVAALAEAAGARIQVFPTPIWRYYAEDMFKWLVKVMVRHPDRRRPTYRDWLSRTQRATYDIRGTSQALGWSPVDQRELLIERGIRACLAQT